jgi:hypothetical protein
MRALFGHGLQPDADQIIALEVATGAGSQEAARAVKLGRAFPQYARLSPRPDRYLAMLRLSVVRSALIVKPHRRYSARAAALSGSVCRDSRSAPASVAACRTITTS